MVYRPEVQAELRLTASQKSRLQQPNKEELRKMGKFFQGLRSVPRSEWAKRSTEFCAAQQQKLDEFLDAGQLQRLRQITLQQEGYFALARPEIADELRITPEQRAQLAAILKKLGVDYRSLLKGSPATTLAGAWPSFSATPTSKLP